MPSPADVDQCGKKMIQLRAARAGLFHSFGRVKEMTGCTSSSDGFWVIRDGVSARS